MKLNVLTGMTYIFLLNILKCHIDPVKDYTPHIHRKCNHEKKTQERYYMSGKYDRKLANTYYSDIHFQNMRIHFDYTYSLPHEEKIIKELVMPPVKRFLESTLSVRRLPGKIRFPKYMKDCQGMPIPQTMKNDGMDTDLIIIVSTFRGMKKYYYENFLNFTDFIGGPDSRRKKESDDNSLNEYLKKFFSKDNDNSSLSNITKKNSTNEASNSSGTTNSPPWDDNSDAPNDVVGWSFMCLQDIYTLRPIAGVMQYVADILPTQRIIEETIWTTLHEITHVLAMDFDLFGDFIDSQFNRLGYEKAIKIKTRLKDLDKMLDERKDFMNDLIKFANFNLTHNETDDIVQNHINDYEDKQKLEKKSMHNSFIKNNRLNSYLSGKNKKIDNFKLNKNLNEKVKTINLKKNRISLIEKKNIVKNTTHNDSLLKTQNSTSIKESLEHQKTINNTKIGKYLNNSSNSSEINIRNYQNKNSSLNNLTSLKNSNSNSDNNFTKSTNPLVNKSKEISKITLPLVEQYYELKIPSNLNLTTIMSYIENFLDYTKIFIITPKVMEVARKHFGCSSIEGVELEHFGGSGSAFSHWSKRILNTEFMIADSYGENYISNFTLALLEDSGWYKVDFSKSDVLPWGQGKGCSFLEEKCITKKKKRNSFFTLSLNQDIKAKSHNISDNLFSNLANVYDSNYKDEFCTSFEEEKCSISHTFRAVCTLYKHSKSLPNDYQYFDNPSIGGMINFGDFCPYPLEWIDPSEVSPIGSCRNGVPLRKDIGEKICENCRCFHSSLIEEKLYKKKFEELKKNKQESNKNLDDTRAACYETKCTIDSKGRSELIIVVNEVEIKCPRGGATLTVEGFKGFVECPIADKICKGYLDSKTDNNYSSTYSLFGNLSQNLFNILYNFISNVFKK